MSKSGKSVALNIIANIISFGISLIISFFLTPYITRVVGIEAYGIVGLANSFTSYITIITTAINSMASRFITIEFHRKNYKKANVYFSSVLVANIVMSLLILAPAIWLISNIQILNISDNLLTDAKITFIIILISFIVNLIGSLYGVVLYAKNIIWKGSFRTAESNAIRIALIFIFFGVFTGKIFYVVLASFLSGLYVLFFNVYYTKKYMPELKIKKDYFSFVAIKQLISVGIWNSITRISQVLLDGLDLLFSNLFIDGTMTGNISLAKTIPSLYTSVVAMFSDSFYPTFLKFYSMNDHKSLISEIKNSITILSTISGVAMSFIIVNSKEFYQLWVPGCDAGLLQNITILSSGTVLISGCIYSLFSVFSLTNKIKQNSIALIITGVLSAITTFVSLKFVNLGVYAIVGVSSIFGIIRNLTFTPIFAAKCLNLKKWTFYPTILKNLLNIVFLIFIDYLIKKLLPINSWLIFLVNGVIDAVLGFVVTFILIFNRNQKMQIIKKIKSRIGRI